MCQVSLAEISHVTPQLKENWEKTYLATLLWSVGRYACGVPSHIKIKELIMMLMILISINNNNVIIIVSILLLL